MSGDDDDDGDGDGDRDRDRDRDRDADVVEAVSGVDCFGEGREHSSGVGFRRFRRLENQVVCWMLKSLRRVFFFCFVFVQLGGKER